MTTVYKNHRDADNLQPPAEQTTAMWKVVLNSPRESVEYYTALVSLVYIKRDRAHLYSLKDEADIDRMLDILYSVSAAPSTVSPPYEC